MKILRAVTVFMIVLLICVTAEVLYRTEETDASVMSITEGSVTALSGAVTTFDYTSHAVRTDGYLESGDYPRVFIARSVKDVVKYRRLYENVYDFSYGTINECAGEMSFDDITAQYGDDYYKTGALLLTVCTSPTYAAPEFDGISADGCVIMTVGKGDDAVQWHVITEIKPEAAAQVRGVSYGGTRYDGYAAFSRVW